jgi:sec-independent protein translocase protein TatA
MELVIILLVLVMLFGATRLADIGGSLGKGIREFRKNISDDDEPAAETPKATTVMETAPAAAPQNGVETVSSIKCPNCGALNPMGAKHCNQCGAEIAAPVS